MAERKFKSNAEIAVQILLVSNLLRALAIDETLPYAPILSALEVNDIERGRRRLEQARKLVEREDGYLFSTVPCVGVKRIPIEMTGTVVGHAAKKAAKAIRRGIKRGRLHAPRLTGEAKRETEARLSILGPIASSLTERRFRKHYEPSNTIGPMMPVQAKP